MSIKYQIFISSTYDDLRSERDQVIKAILEMGHIPVGMEMFSAADDEQWKIIAKQIDEIDYYIVIVAHRYGSMVEGISYTEKEYDYAIEKGVPALGFVIDEKAPWPADRFDRDHTTIERLNSFKSKVKKKPIGFWSTSSDLHGKVSVALVKAFNTNPRPGWTRASNLPTPDVVAELGRLSRENAELRLKIEDMTRKSVADAENRLRDLNSHLRDATVGLSIWYDGDTDWTNEKTVSLLDVFLTVAPNLIPEMSEKQLSRLAAFSLSKNKKRTSRSSWPIPSNLIRSWLADLAIFDLLAPSKAKKPVSDKETYWCLTELGKELFGWFRKTVFSAESQKESKPKRQ